jgi:hypothetical protein
MAASVCGAQQRHLFPRRQYGLPQPSEAPRRPELCADEQTIETMLSADYWRLLCPDLHVDGASLSSSSSSESGGTCGAATTAASDATPTPLEVDSADVAVLHGLLEREGYFTLDAPALGWPPGYMERLARGVVALLQHGWPAAFIAMCVRPEPRRPPAHRVRVPCVARVPIRCLFVRGLLPLSRLPA